MLSRFRSLTFPRAVIDISTTKKTVECIERLQGLCKNTHRNVEIADCQSVDFFLGEPTYWRKKIIKMRLNKWKRYILKKN